MNVPDEAVVEANGRFWPPFLVMLVLTPFFLLAGMLSAGGGHGSYFIAKLVFPFTMLSTIVFNVIMPPFMILAIAQFPLYGLALGLMNRRGNLIPALIGILFLHLGAALACVFLIGENF